MSELRIVSPLALTQTIQITKDDTWEQERREVLHSVMGALSSSSPDREEMAACSFLLRHLAKSGESRAA